MAQSSRPLSPHLQIYRWSWTMAMSIGHRITGGALHVGTILLAAWLAALAAGPDAYATAQWIAGSWLGQLVLFGFTFALMQHLMGGVRHIIWDYGYMHGPSERILLSKASLFGAVALTVLVWIVAYAFR